MWTVSETLAFCRLFSPLFLSCKSHLFFGPCCLAIKPCSHNILSFGFKTIYDFTIGNINLRKQPLSACMGIILSRKVGGVPRKRLT